MIQIQPVTTTQSVDRVIRTGMDFFTTTAEDGAVLTTGVIRGYTADSAGTPIGEIRADMTSDEYNAWGDSDDYPTLLLIQKNGLTAV